MNNKAILRVAGQLQQGISASLTQFVYDNGGDIIDFDQYVDLECEPNRYYGRIEWSMDNFQIAADDLEQQLVTSIGQKFNASINLNVVTKPLRLAILVTRDLPCFYSIVMKSIARDWNAEPTLVVSNHETLKFEAERFQIPFYSLPVTPDTRESQGKTLLSLLADNSIDLVVLAKYMQIIPANVIAEYRDRIINIHHSMLPSFVGARPYHRAREYGVKFIGATAHYVTEGLDEGPIIVQGIKSISHKQTSAELVNIGKSIEAEVMLRALELHIDRRIMIAGRRSVIFD